MKGIIGTKALHMDYIKKCHRERKHSILLDKECVNAIEISDFSHPKDESNFIKIAKDLYS